MIFNSLNKFIKLTTNHYILYTLSILSQIKHTLLIFIFYHFSQVQIHFSPAFLY
ncbi:hypothetical protein MtrunA17_Chr2g0309951 [Medicago truncatula]|uniref:Transmembrane protein n=1 Tax=Medicago truncatula TaxID=3880 RepID=A0A396J815_MEDTR|nr:hypothetical protein MtrunA17_Chr2g0309951 [Medicago truncatula]